LEGITVVEACQMVAGPFAAMICADLGADVIKVEQPKGGDRFRLLGDRVGGISAVWANVNRGKRSLVIDLQQSDGLAAMRDLIRTADVFIQNFRPGVAARLGIDEPSLRAEHPTLVYVSVSGFGDTGPYIDQKSYDYVVQMLCGMAALQGGDGIPALIRNIVVDKVTAMTATQSILAALIARPRVGGQHVRLSMIDTALAFLWPDGMMQHTFLDTDRVTRGAHLADGYVVRPTKDSFLAVLATSNSQFPGLCTALHKEEWRTDPRFATLADRERNADILSELISVEVAKCEGRPLVAALQAHDVPCALSNQLQEVHLDPQVLHNDVLVELDRPWIGRVREPRPPAHYSATPTALGRHAPKLDEHTDEILRELGRDDAKIAAMRASGAAGPRR
jgi:crotonobetainyl-CoA:carnitine CoA-transferase CaiB-like acyl-CoA transferase